MCVRSACARVCGGRLCRAQGPACLKGAGTGSRRGGRPHTCLLGCEACFPGAQVAVSVHLDPEWGKDKKSRTVPALLKTNLAPGEACSSPSCQSHLPAPARPPPKDKAESSDLITPQKGSDSEAPPTPPGLLLGPEALLSHTCALLHQALEARVWEAPCCMAPAADDHGPLAHFVTAPRGQGWTLGFVDITHQGSGQGMGSLVEEGRGRSGQEV